MCVCARTCLSVRIITVEAIYPKIGTSHVRDGSKLTCISTANHCTITTTTFRLHGQCMPNSPFTHNPTTRRSTVVC